MVLTVATTAKNPDGGVRSVQLHATLDEHDRVNGALGTKQVYDYTHNPTAESSDQHQPQPGEKVDSDRYLFQLVHKAVPLSGDPAAYCTDLYSISA